MSSDIKRLSRWDEINRLEGILSEGIKYFHGKENEFSESRQAPEFSKAQSGFALEHTVDILFSEVMGLGKELISLYSGNQEDERLDAITVINTLKEYKVLSLGLADSLHSIRMNRNVVEHEHSLSPPGPVWRDALEWLNILPKLKENLIRSYSGYNITLPKYFSGVENGL